MSAKRKYGIFFQARNSYKKYPQLDDLDNLKKLMIIDRISPSKVAKMLEVPYNSLRHQIVTWFTQEEIEQVPWERIRHQNRKYTK